MDIIVVDPNGNQRKYNIEAFQKEVVSFGRQPDNDIVFNYDFVSRVHGVIYREGMQYYIEDMNSTNGICRLEYARKLDAERYKDERTVPLSELNKQDKE